jgi:hypothetical protein
MEVNGCNKERQVTQEPNWKDKTQTGNANALLINSFMCNLPSIYIDKSVQWNVDYTVSTYNTLPKHKYTNTGNC